MNTRRMVAVVLMAGGTAIMQMQPCSAQCCLTDFFAGLGSCCQTAPPRPVAVAPVMAQPIPVVAPVVAPAPPPQPVMVPVQQVSYVPETCYKTQYECVPVTCYRPVTEIDPCTGCTTQCMQQETSYVQKAVNVPYTQYRAVYSTKYVQVQPGAAGAAAVPAATYAPATATAPAGAAVSPFAAPVQQPAGWAAAGADVPPTLVPQQGTVTQPIAPQQSFQQQIIPQSGTLTPGQTYAQPIPSQSGATLQQPTLSPTAPPQLSPTPGPQTSNFPSPSLRPIPESTPSGPTPSPRDASGGHNATPPSLQGGSTLQQPTQGQQPVPGQRPTTLQPAPAPSNTQGLMPVVPGSGPNTATGAFPRLLEPTGHTTRSPAASGYPTAALPSRLQ